MFSIILTVFFLWLFVEGIRNVNFWEILFSIAFICIIYDEPLGITALTPWTVLGAAFLGSIGLSLIFGGKKRKWKTVTGNVGTSSSEQYTGEGDPVREQLRFRNPLHQLRQLQTRRHRK